MILDAGAKTITAINRCFDRKNLRQQCSVRGSRCQLCEHAVQILLHIWIELLEPGG